MVNNDYLDNKKKYRELCRKERSIPIFSKDWWLDAVAGDNWDVALVENNGEVIAALPFVKKKKIIFDVISMPKLTQNLGIWVKYPENQKYANRLSFEKEIYTQLIEQIPYFDYFSQNFHYSMTNWLPFYWKGFEQTTRYTYVIEDISDLGKVYDNFKSNIRGKIKKAQKIVGVELTESIDLFYELNRKTFERQGIKIPYTLDFLREKDKIVSRNHARKIFVAKDGEGRVHSSLYLIWDSDSSYVHMVGEDPDLRRSGAGILLIWEAIKFTKEKIGLNKFDFEGSMIENIESVRRAFGAIQKPYFQITKINSKLLKSGKFLKGVFK